jgi:hypothetical protein
MLRLFTLLGGLPYKEVVKLVVSFGYVNGLLGLT